MQYRSDHNRHNVHQAYVQFLGAAQESWAQPWKEFMDELSSMIQELVAKGYGVLSVDIQKTNPEYGVLYTAMITYWDRP